MINKIYNRSNNKATNNDTDNDSGSGNITANPRCEETQTETVATYVASKEVFRFFFALHVEQPASYQEHNKMQFRHQKYTVNGARVPSARRKGANRGGNSRKRVRDRVTDKQGPKNRIRIHDKRQTGERHTQDTKDEPARARKEKCSIKPALLGWQKLWQKMISI